MKRRHFIEVNPRDPRGLESVDLEGETLRDLIDSWDRVCPGIKDRLLHNDERLKRIVDISILGPDDEFIRVELDEILPPDARMYLWYTL